MANRKVKPENKKKVKSYSMRTKIADNFTNHCIENDLSASTIVESLIENYLNEQKQLNGLFR